MKRSHPMQGDRSLMRERMDPNDPWIRPVPYTARQRLHLQRHMRKWKAGVIGRRIKDFPFTSLAQMRRNWRERRAIYQASQDLTDAGWEPKHDPVR